MEGKTRLLSQLNGLEQMDEKCRLGLKSRDAVRKRQGLRHGGLRHAVRSNQQQNPSSNSRHEPENTQLFAGKRKMQFGSQFFAIFTSNAADSEERERGAESVLK